MKKKKTSLKKRIFALLGIITILLSFTISAFANDTDTAPIDNEIEEHASDNDFDFLTYVPDVPNTNLSPTYVTAGGFMGGAEVINLPNHATIVTTTIKDGVTGNYVYDNIPIDGGVAQWVNGVIQTRTTSYSVFNLRTTYNYYLTNSAYGATMHCRNGIELKYGSSFERVNFTASNFWVYPTKKLNMPHDNLIGSYSVIDVNGNRILGDLVVNCNWRFMGSGAIYTSNFIVDNNTDYVFTNDLINTVSKVNGVAFDGFTGLTLDNYCVPINVEYISVEFIPEVPITDYFTIFTRTPAMKTRELDLDLIEVRSSFNLGSFHSTEFNLGFVFDAVSSALATPLVGGISISAIVIAFLSLAIVLAVLAMFRGST